MGGIMFTGFGRGEYVDNFYHTGPSPNTNMANAFLVEIVGTAMLLIIIGFLVNGGPPAPNKGVVAFGVGAISFFIGMTMGYLTGYSLNPARELSPRLVRTIDDLFRNGGRCGEHLGQRRLVGANFWSTDWWSHRHADLEAHQQADGSSDRGHDRDGLSAQDGRPHGGWKSSCFY